MKAPPLPARFGHPWDDDEDVKLLAMFDAGTPLKAIAKALLRTDSSCRLRLEKHGREFPAVCNVEKKP